MKVTPTAVPDVWLLEPETFTDARGVFAEVWHRQRFAGCGIDYDFVQDNVSRSVEGALRGLHYQIQQPQGKLVSVVTGEIFDVAVDIRKSSPTFGQWAATRLSAGVMRSLWIPPGFAHGFYVTRGPAEVHYKCTDYYAPTFERNILWNDPELNISWPLNGDPLLSEKDESKGRLFEQAEHYS